VNHCETWPLRREIACSLQLPALTALGCLQCQGPLHDNTRCALGKGYGLLSPLPFVRIAYLPSACSLKLPALLILVYLQYQGPWRELTCCKLGKGFGLLSPLPFVRVAYLPIVCSLQLPALPAFGCLLFLWPAEPASLSGLCVAQLLGYCSCRHFSPLAVCSVKAHCLKLHVLHLAKTMAF
jgi:hypothetical protein